MIRAVLPIAVICFANCAFANTSVWDDAKRGSNQVIGKIVSIGNDGSDIIVRISNGKQSDTFRVCASNPGGDATNLSETDRVHSLRDAFNHGDIVEASYNSPFERCLNYVEVRHDVKPQEKLADKSNNLRQNAAPKPN